MKNSKFSSLRMSIIMIALAGMMTGCSGGNDDSENDGNPTSTKNGYAFETAKGHAFAFYHNNGKWMFSASVNQNGGVKVNFPDEGFILAEEYEPSFDYYKKGKDEASVLVFITLKVRMSSGWVYNYKYYSGHYALKFTSAKKGTFSWYDDYTDFDINDLFPTKRLIATGKFEVER